MKNILIVAAGGSVGAVTRYMVSVWAVQRLGAQFPYGTLIVNIIGCFIIGFFMTAAAAMIDIKPELRLLITVGFVGGMTTFSSFSYETFTLADQIGIPHAILNVLANMIIGFLATWLGLYLGRLVS